MIYYKGIKYSLNDCPRFVDKKLSGRSFSYAIENEEYLRPLNASSFKEAKKQVEEMIDIILIQSKHQKENDKSFVKPNNVSDV